MPRTTKTTDAVENTSPSHITEEVLVTEAPSTQTAQTTAHNTITAYGFAKIVNTRMKEAGLKELPAQMFYSYAKKGMLGTETKPLTPEYAAVWTEEYLVRRVTREQAKVAKIEAELNGNHNVASDDPINEPDLSTE